MKKCLVISMGRMTGETIANQLQSILGSGVEITYTQTKNREVYAEDKQSAYDVFLFTSDVAYMASAAQASINCTFIIGARVINHKNIEQLISLPAGTSALLLNDSEDSAKEAIDQLVDIGLDHIHYHPCFPGSRKHPKLGVVITPGEPQLMPDCGEELIDIGTRILDLKTIYEVKEKLGLRDMIHDSLVVTYIKDIIGITKSIDHSRRAEKESKRVLETIFDTVDNGIAYLDRSHHIVKVNSKLQHILGKNRRDLLGKTIGSVIPSITSGVLTAETIKLEIRDESFIVYFEEVLIDSESAYLMMVYPLQKIKQMDQKSYGRVVSGGLTHLKSFDDYLSIHPDVQASLERADRFAKTDATISIQGENGTGKEIIAQAIHRNSYRKNKPFVPVNIAAISNNLLESELFGYEKGAFTGASKEGKIGLFEVADGGTLFIDEIGDAPLDIQVKLLRVLQEKKIRRVGGVEEIPVDVRIISATNKDLLKLVDDEAFREDLYFRLNILPLYTVPLRMRPQDINHLLTHFLKLYFDESDIKVLGDYFEVETLEFLNKYRWRGNVRELINLVEYLSYIYDGKPFKLLDLPNYYLTQDIKERHLSEDELWLLKQVFYMPGSGRGSLSKLAKEEGYHLGEGQIRRLLSDLQTEGLLETYDKSRGVLVTENGKALLSKHI